MIVFLSEKRVEAALRSKFNKRPVIVFNLTSFYNSSHYDVSVTNLAVNANLVQAPLPMPQFVEMLEFDMRYAELLLSQPQMFHSLFSIVYYNYIGYLVIVLVQRDRYRDCIMESIMKLIQQRYGFNSWLLEDINDVELVDEGSYTSIGIMNIDADIQRHIKMYQMGQVPKLINVDYNM